MTTSDFKEGDNVIYVPLHAQGNINHEDCEHGVVSSTNSKFVFVKYVRGGILQQTAEPTDPKYLMPKQEDEEDEALHLEAQIALCSACRFGNDPCVCGDNQGFLIEDWEDDDDWEDDQYEDEYDNEF